MKENNDGSDTNVGSIGNSIEDRINNAYCFLNSMRSDFRTGLYYKEDLENLEHILSDYKRVLKENEELNYKLHSKKIALEIYNRYIPKSKVEEKIEEIQKEYEETLKTANFKEIEKMNKINFRGITLEGQRSILRELLENRK